MSERTDNEYQHEQSHTAAVAKEGSLPAFLGGTTDTDAAICDLSPCAATAGSAPVDADAAGPADAAHADAPANENAKSTPEGDFTPSGIEHAADTARSLISEGVAGVREARAAKRAHADAREHLELLQRTISEREEESADRRDVAENFDAIVAEQQARRTTAAATKAEADRLKAEHETQAASLKEELERMREADNATEKRLKSALDAAEAKEASARESGSRLQRRVDDAERNLARAEQERTEGIAAAERAIASAQEHLDTLKAEFVEISAIPRQTLQRTPCAAASSPGKIADATEALRRAPTTCRASKPKPPRPSSRLARY